MTGSLAAIDVGTNSIHLVVARIVGHERFEVVEREKAMVRLGEGGGDMKRLSAEAIDRGVATLARFRQIAEIHDASIRAVATSAVREAENSDEFLQRAADEAKVEVEVISGAEEARLIHLGVLQALPLYDKRIFLCDIGGGSTELLIGQRGETLAVRSLKLGAVRLTNRFFPGDRLRAAAVEECRHHVRSALQPFRREVEAHGFEVAVGSSGTVMALAELVCALTGQSPKTMNGFTFTAEQLHDAVEAVLDAKTVARRAELPGMDARRADIIVAGSLILAGVVDCFGIEQLTVSDYALREGVLLDTLQRTRGGTLHHLRDVSRRSVQHLASLMDEEPEHSAQVARLALRLFDATSLVHGLGEDCREYLEAGALLANIGLFISHSKHHLHSYYVIRNTERLTGFTDHEIEIIAQVARYHRKSHPKPSHPEFARLRPEDQLVVRTLAGLLRVAIALDRSHEGRVADVEVRRSGGRVEIRAVPKGEADISLELYAANERKGLLEEVLGLPVEVVARPPVPAP